MREIKFRGQSNRVWNKRGKWVYGDCLHEASGLAIWSKVPGGFQNIPVIPDTVGQYTGMKDSTGKEIYEGDIVRTDDEDEELAMIEWGDDTLKFMVTHGNVCSDLGEYYPREIEVVGNMYDDPELLGGAHDEQSMK